MSAVLLDTQALIWFVGPKENLGRRSLRLAERAAADRSLMVSAVTFWEVSRLLERGRIRLSATVREWRRMVLAEGIGEVPVDGELAIRAHELMPYHPDPFDHFIAGAALVSDATLVTTDGPLLAWKGRLARQNARE